MANTGKVLIVRHGMGRGRERNYFGEFLGFLRQIRPNIHSRLAFHETGTAAPALDGIAAVVFWLGDPLREMYPDCYADAEKIANEARARGIRLINPPEVLSNTIKTRQSQLWREAGVPSAESVLFKTPEELRGILDRLKPPVIVRPAMTHAQQGVRICDSVDAALEAAAKILPAPAMVAPLIDVRAGWRAAGGPGNLYARLFHCKRCYVYGSTVKTVYMLFSPSPVVAGPTSTFNAKMRETLKLPAKPLPGSWDASCVAEDFLFGTGPAEDPDLMRRAARALGLEYVAIDYSTNADGSHVLWEANPYPFIRPLPQSALAEERRMKPRYGALYDVLGSFLLQLAEGGRS